MEINDLNIYVSEYQGVFPVPDKVFYNEKGDVTKLPKDISYVICTSMDIDARILRELLGQLGISIIKNVNGNFYLNDDDMEMIKVVTSFNSSNIRDLTLRTYRVKHDSI